MSIEIKLQGYIKVYCHEGEFRAIKLVDGDQESDLVTKFKAIFDLYESEVSVNFFVCDKKISEKEVLEAHIAKLSGAIDAKYESYSYDYSEHSYGTYHDTYLQIGGHNLLDELSDSEGKWCLMKINVLVNP